MRITSAIAYFLLIAFAASATTTVNVVTDYGAIGNGQFFYLQTTSNSPIIVANSAIIAPNIGDIVETLGCGKQTYGFDSYASKTNTAIGFINPPILYYYYGAITNVVNGTNIYCDSHDLGSEIFTSTNDLSSDVGAGIEVSTDGTHGNLWSEPPQIHYTDFIANITNVINATNLYVDQLPQQTFTNQYGAAGHDNRTNFQAAFDAINDTNYIINTPAGIYLTTGTNRPNDAPPRNDPTAWYAIKIQKGGWHLIGQGTNATRIVAQFAWLQQTYTSGITYSNVCKRAGIFGIVPTAPVMSNDYPCSIENIYLDGGLTNGNTSIHGTYPNNIDGEGWDGSHWAIDVRGFPGSSITYMTWSNLLIAHIRGEMVKSNDGTTNGNLKVYNCTFADSTAQAWNYYTSTYWTNCIFDDLYQVGEFYQLFSTNTSEMAGCLFTNIYVNGFTINGGAMYAPPFLFHGNHIYFYGSGRNFLMTTPACNYFIYNNDFHAVGAALGHTQYAIVIGSAGYQSSANSMNSNIVIYANTFWDISNPLSYGAGNPPIGGTNYSDSNWTTDLRFYGNTIKATTNGLYPVIASGNGWAVNVTITSNVVDASVDTYFPQNGRFTSGGRGEPITLIPTNNIYWYYLYNLSPDASKGIDYGISGSRAQATGKYYSGSYYYLVDSNAIPAGAQIIITNAVTENGAGTTIPIVSGISTIQTTNYLSLNQTATYDWNVTSGTWETNASSGGGGGISSDPNYNSPPQFLFRR